MKPLKNALDEAFNLTQDDTGTYLFPSNWKDNVAESVVRCKSMNISNTDKNAIDVLSSITEWCPDLSSTSKAINEVFDEEVTHHKLMLYFKKNHQKMSTDKVPMNYNGSGNKYRIEPPRNIVKREYM